MSVCHDSVVQEVRPGTARVQVTELSGSGSINPTPARKANQDQDKAVEPYLSPKRLELLCGTHDLSRVNHLEICVDTQENTLGDFVFLAGAYLPRLEQLKMNNSFVMSLRDLGTTLSHLQVLWMSHCCLQDLSGISTFDSLKELYLPYNNVSDLSQVAMLENLRLLDLEGNCVDDLIQIQYLGLCPNLQTLTLEGNPVSKRPNPASPQAKEYNYRAAVRELVPQLRYLDDVKVEEDKLTCCSTTQEDWDILRMSFQESNSFETAEKIARHLRHGAHITGPLGARPASSASMRPILATGRKLLSPPGSRPASSDSDVASVEAETSTLTHGAGKILFCGNPVQAVRARREKLNTAPTRSSLVLRDLPIHVPEHTYDLNEPDPEERVNVFAELRAWREQHSKQLAIIEKERLPQVLVIHHSDEEEAESEEEEEEGFGGMKSDSSDEDQEEDELCDSLATGSPDSSFQSLSPDLNQQETSFPNMVPLSLSTDTTPCPSPPVHVTAAPVNTKLPGIRARKLRLPLSHPEQLSRKDLAPQTLSAAAETELMSKRHVARPTYSPHPPPKRYPCEGPVISSAGMERSSLPLTSKQKMSKVLQRPVISRPHTARAVLQKHPQQHLLQPSRGSSDLD
ncbi:PREDICTED: leucine-rich repeat-containing protein 56 isoform X1 [Poecilia mexicana]|uniref:leucine-rich repeat-containing protein 56 isoform X1 n=1 Tax=Poecilia mexicana TaxID=48701 RepID=UPI00072EAEBA|nr:PREDICTED: leucine-rich repeat-containing protein 56 isoform X1 [Poecilia mexicana]